MNLQEHKKLTDQWKSEYRMAVAAVRHRHDRVDSDFISCQTAIRQLRRERKSSLYERIYGITLEEFDRVAEFIIAEAAGWKQKHKLTDLPHRIQIYLRGSERSYQELAIQLSHSRKNAIASWLREADAYLTAYHAARQKLAEEEARKASSSASGKLVEQRRKLATENAKAAQREKVASRRQKKSEQPPVPVIDEGVLEAAMADAEPDDLPSEDDLFGDIDELTITPSFSDEGNDEEG